MPIMEEQNEYHKEITYLGSVFAMEQIIKTRQEEEELWQKLPVYLIKLTVHLDLGLVHPVAPVC
jgi:hypothetical protein